MTATTAGTGKIVIPYGSKAGQEAFNIFRKIAQRLCREATEATDAYIAATYPDGETVGAEHADGLYQRTVRTAAGESRTILYNYQTKEIWVE